VIAAALDSLAWLGDSEVKAAVERALSHSDHEVFQAALRAASTLPATDAEGFLARGLQHAAWNVRMLAIKLLLDIGTKRTRELLTDALSIESDSMVRHAIESGLRLGD
jgi:HEAT repeat protein